MAIVNLVELYKNTIAAVLEHQHKLDTAEQADGSGLSGRLWAMRHGTTVPELIISYEFDNNGAKFTLVDRNMRQSGYNLAYVEGVEGFLGDMAKFINAGRLAAPKK